MDTSLPVWGYRNPAELTFGNEDGWINFEYSNNNRTIKKTSSEGYGLGVITSFVSGSNPAYVDFRIDNVKEKTGMIIGLTWITEHDVVKDGISGYRGNCVWSPTARKVMAGEGRGDVQDVSWPELNNGDIIRVFYDANAEEFYVAVNGTTFEKISTKKLSPEHKNLRPFIDFRIPEEQVTIV